MKTSLSGQSYVTVTEKCKKLQSLKIVGIDTSK